MWSRLKPKPNSRPSKEAEERFLKAGAEMFATAFPTPEGWPRFESVALKAAANRSHREQLSANLVDELTWCSETFVEYGHYLQKARSARRMRLVAICMAVAVAIAALRW